eukprot:3572592-Prymnesium_polylepis.3
MRRGGTERTWRSPWTAAQMPTATPRKSRKSINSAANAALPRLAPSSAGGLPPALLLPLFARSPPARRRRRRRRCLP